MLYYFINSIKPALKSNITNEYIDYFGLEIIDNNHNPLVLYSFSHISNKVIIDLNKSISLIEYNDLFKRDVEVVRLYLEWLIYP